MKSPGEFDDISRLDPPVSRIDDESQPGYSLFARYDLSLRLVDGQAQGTQEFNDCPFPFVQAAFAVTEEGEVVNISQIWRTPQIIGYEPIEGRHINIAPEQAGQVTDG